MFAILFCITLAAQETDKTLSPYFMVYTSDKEQHTDVLPLKSTSVTADIVGNIANATVKQQYINTGKAHWKLYILFLYLPKPPYMQ